MTKRKTKAEETAELVAAAVGAGRKLKLPSVDFSDPNRPKTCLEVDFPILPINQIAQIEGNGGKPIYQMSKWWARRRSSVFRAMLIAAATKAPDDPLEAAKTVWDAYYANHQDNEAFRDLKVADIFMGGGTTLVEGSRLGMQMFGNDLNPVAWFVVKNELADVDLDEVEKLFDHIEREVKPQIMPFYACEGPGGERGTWTHLPGGEVMGEDFDPLALSPEERKDYGYEGPEVIYTFWAKHGPCSAPGCGHRTPLFTSLVIAVKTLSVKTWADFECRECRECRESFDVERAAARMAPYVPLVAADSEVPFAVMGAEGRFACPHCGKEHRDEVALEKGCWKAHELPLSESAASLTSAKIYLLPHQVVLTHRVATASPRRFLIADEVGLGKTIETALILRELASRGELRRALMVVPAGLVNNWHRELNEVFNLDFEVFGREGDVSDRRSNAFEKHDRLIASIDTLKRPARVKRLLEAPPWDLVVFDEAHHMTAYRSGSKVKKTENYKLGEALRDHARDLLLLSATPHQGDHFRFFKLIQLLDPTLFEDANEMVEHRHRLNPVVFRRTKADACRADGSTLFARRWVPPNPSSCPTWSGSSIWR